MQIHTHNIYFWGENIIFVFFERFGHIQHAKRLFFIFFVFFLRPCLAKKTLIFLEIKTTQNKSKGCLPNTPLNQNNLNKKQQTKQGLMTDLVWTWLG